MKVSIVILTYQSVHHLRDLLPSLVRVLPSIRVATEVIVLENGRDPGTEQLVTKEFPAFRHLYAESNDFLFSLNPLVASLDSDYVLILNDDMAMVEFDLDRAVGILEAHPQLFGANLAMAEWESTQPHWTVRDFRYGKAYYHWEWKHNLRDEICYTLYPNGASGLYRRSMFVELGGYSRLYHPAYSEDLDLGWRAWHRGWPSVYVPGTVIRHKEGASWENKAGTRRRLRMMLANRMLCMLRNSTVPGFQRAFLARLPYRLAVGLRGGGDVAAAYWRVLGKLAEVRRARRLDPPPVIDDWEMMARIGEVV